MKTDFFFLIILIIIFIATVFILLRWSKVLSDEYTSIVTPNYSQPGIGEPCTTENVDRGSLPYQYNFGNCGNQLRCVNGIVSGGGICLSIIGGDCATVKDCAPEADICLNGKCEITGGQLNQPCDPTQSKITESMLRGEQVSTCNGINYMICDSSNADKNNSSVCKYQPVDDSLDIDLATIKYPSITVRDPYRSITDIYDNADINIEAGKKLFGCTIDDDCYQPGDSNEAFCYFDSNIRSGKQGICKYKSYPGTNLSSRYQIAGGSTLTTTMKCVDGTVQVEDPTTGYKYCQNSTQKLNNSIATTRKLCRFDIESNIPSGLSCGEMEGLSTTCNFDAEIRDLVNLSLTSTDRNQNHLIGSCSVKTATRYGRCNYSTNNCESGTICIEYTSLTDTASGIINACNTQSDANICYGDTCLTQMTCKYTTPSKNSRNEISTGYCYGEAGMTCDANGECDSSTAICGAATEGEEFYINVFDPASTLSNRKWSKFISTAIPHATQLFGVSAPNTYFPTLRTWSSLGANGVIDEYRFLIGRYARTGDFSNGFSTQRSYIYGSGTLYFYYYKTNSSGGIIHEGTLTINLGANSYIINFDFDADGDLVFMYFADSSGLSLRIGHVLANSISGDTTIDINASSDGDNFCYFFGDSTTGTSRFDQPYNIWFSVDKERTYNLATDAGTAEYNLIVAGIPVKTSFQDSGDVTAKYVCLMYLFYRKDNSAAATTYDTIQSLTDIGLNNYYTRIYSYEKTTSLYTVPSRFLTYVKAPDILDNNNTNINNTYNGRYQMTASQLCKIQILDCFVDDKNFIYSKVMITYENVEQRQMASMIYYLTYNVPIIQVETSENNGAPHLYSDKITSGGKNYPPRGNILNTFLGGSNVYGWDRVFYGNTTPEYTLTDNLEWFYLNSNESVTVSGITSSQFGYQTNNLCYDSTNLVGWRNPISQLCPTLWHYRYPDIIKHPLSNFDVNQIYDFIHEGVGNNKFGNISGYLLGSFSDKGGSDSFDSLIYINEADNNLVGFFKEVGIPLRYNSYVNKSGKGPYTTTTSPFGPNGSKFAQEMYGDRIFSVSRVCTAT